MKAMFLDRDNTIIIDKGYMYKLEDINYYDDTFDFIRGVQNLGYEIFMVTNQSGIGRGFFQEEDMHKFHAKINQDLKDQGLKPFHDIEFCPHHPDDPENFRKPSPIMIENLCKKYPINLKESYMVGDKLIDAECGENAGCTGVTLRVDSSPHLNFNCLADFLEYLKAQA